MAEKDKGSNAPRGAKSNQTKGDAILDVMRRFEVAQEIMDDLKDEIRQLSGGGNAQNLQTLDRIKESPQADPTIHYLLEQLGKQLDCTNETYYQIAGQLDNIFGERARPTGPVECNTESPVNMSNVKSILIRYVDFISEINEKMNYAAERLRNGL